MAALEDLKAAATVKGLSPAGLAKVVQIEWFGDQAVKATFEDGAGAVRNRLVYRNEEPTLEVVTAGRPWSFDGDGHLMRLVSEAYRIRLAHLFDPLPRHSHLAHRGVAAPDDGRLRRDAAASATAFPARR